MDGGPAAGEKFKGSCHWCGNVGHKEAECRKKASGAPKAKAKTKAKAKAKANAGRERKKEEEEPAGLAEAESA